MFNEIIRVSEPALFSLVMMSPVQTKLPMMHFFLLCLMQQNIQVNYLLNLLQVLVNIIWLYDFALNGNINVMFNTYNYTKILFNYSKVFQYSINRDDQIDGLKAPDK